MKKTKMLKKNFQFKNVLTKGKYYSGEFIEAFIKPHYKNTNYNYLGIAISSKICKAVRRNKIKRLIRECYKNTELNIKMNQEIVFLWKKKADIKNANFFNIQTDMNKIFNKANIFLRNEFEE